MKGLFITFEGVEGCGKSTQARLLAEALRASGHEVLLTREPGGTRIGEKIRAILLDPENDAMASRAELLLYEAARAQLVAESIAPALESGTIVICDRFYDSTTVYQGAGRKLDAIDMPALHNLATGGLVPDLTLLLDVPVDTGLARAGAGGEHDRIEREPLAFHQRVRDGFLALADGERDRVVCLDGLRAVDELAEEIAALANRRLDARVSEGAR